MASGEVPTPALENHPQMAAGHADYLPRASVAEARYSASMMPTFPSPLYIPNSSTRSQQPYVSIPEEYKYYNKHHSTSSSVAMRTSGSDSHNLDNLDHSLKSLMHAHASQNISPGSDNNEDGSSQTVQSKQFDPIRNLMPMRQHTKWTLQQQRRNAEPMNSQQAFGESDRPVQETDTVRPMQETSRMAFQDQNRPPLQQEQMNTCQPGETSHSGYNRPYAREAGVTDNHIEQLVNEYYADRNPMSANQEEREEDEEGSSQQGAALSDAENESDTREGDLDEEDNLEGDEGVDTDGSSQSHTCEDCLQVFRTRTLLIYHQRKNWHGGLEPYICPECGQEFGVKSHLRSHVATHSAIKPFQCPVRGCERTFARVDQVNNHLRFRHRTLSKVHRKDYYNDRSFDLKNKKITGIPLVEGAVASPSGANTNDKEPGAATDITCEDCGKTFKNRTLFYYHQHKNSHGGKVPYVCTVCNATFGVRTHLKLHVRKHTKERPYQCPIPNCGRFFSRIDAVNIHLKNLHNNAARVGAKDYRNVPVNDVFPVLPPNMPMPQVNQERRAEGHAFSCSDCDAVYKTKALLDYHQRKLRHGGMQPFSCPVCGAGFGHRSHLRGHLRKHTRARPFFCPIPGCTKRFSRVDIVNVHLKRVHKETLKVTMKDYVGLDLDGPHGKAIMSTMQSGVHPVLPTNNEEPGTPTPGDNPNQSENPSDGDRSGMNGNDPFNQGMNLLLPSALNNVSLQLPATAMLSPLGMRPGMAASTQANYMCNLCQKPFTDLISLQAHMRQHGTPKLYLCPVPGCGKYLSRVGIVNNHLQAIHGLNIRVSAWDYKSQRIPMFDPTKQVNSNQQNPGNFLSPPLGGMDKNNMDLLFNNSAMKNLDHSMLNTMNKHTNLLALPPERFSILGSKFHKKFAMAGAHLDNVTIMRKRRAKMTFKSKSIWCKCEQCSYQTSTKMMMILHQRRHKGVNRYRCKHCGATFHLKSIYYRHVIKCAGTSQTELSTRRGSKHVNFTDENPSSPKFSPFSPLQHMGPAHSAPEVASKYFQANSHAEHMTNAHRPANLTQNQSPVICSPPNIALDRNSSTGQPANDTGGQSNDRHNTYLDHTHLPASSSATSDDLKNTYLKMLQFDSNKNSAKVNATQGSQTDHSTTETSRINYNSHASVALGGGAFAHGLQGQAGLMGSQVNSGTLSGVSEFSFHDQMQRQKGAAPVPLPNIEAVAKYIKDRLPTASMYASVAQTILSCTQTYTNSAPNTESNAQPDTHVTYANKSAADSPVKNANSDMIRGSVSTPLHGEQSNVPYNNSHSEQGSGENVSDLQLPSNSANSPLSDQPVHSSNTFTGQKDGQQAPYLSTKDKNVSQNDSFASPKLPSFSQIKTEPLPSGSAMGWGLPGLEVGGMGMAASMYQNLMYPMLAAAAWGNTPYSQSGGGAGGDNASDRISMFAAPGLSPPDSAYKCPDCGEAFRTKPLMVYHQRKNNHGGLHGFACQDCGATFGTRCHLESHSRKHTKERPFTCPLCSSAYSRVDIVNVHLKTVHRSPLKVRASDYSRSKFQTDL